MKQHYTLFVLAGSFAVITLMAGFGGGANSDYPVGAPPGYTNSPGDGQNCSHCMGGTATPVADWIATDVPVTGYLPGQTYNVVVTVTGTGDKGFELSPQDTEGFLRGTLIAGPESKLVGDEKYVTHKLAVSDNPMSWSFQWTAPSPGIGSVTFYASCVVGKLNTRTTTLVVPQQSLGLDEGKITGLKIYPNPVAETMHVSFYSSGSGEVELTVFSLTGQFISTLYQGSCALGEQTLNLPVDLTSGTYLLQIHQKGTRQLKKVVIL